MMRTLLKTVAVIAGLAAVPASAAVIDFSGFAAGTRIDGPLTIGSATFQSSGGALLIDDFGAGNAICAWDGLGCGAALTLSFAEGATGLGIDISGDTVAGSQTMFQGETPILAFTGVSTADGLPSTVESIRLRFEDVLRISLVSNDPGQVGYNNIRFDEVAAVPEPASWALMIGGFGMVGTAMRRRRQAGVRFA
jgi:hypothetical protein